MPADVEQLVRENLGLVGHLAARYLRTHDVPPTVSRDDLKRAGGEGLWRAARRWRPEQSALATFARRKILSNMRDLVARASRRCPVAAGGMGEFADPRSLDPFKRIDEAEAFSHLIIPLMPRERQALTMRYVADEGLVAIGAALGVSESAAWHVIRTAQRRLRERIAA